MSDHGGMNMTDILKEHLKENYNEFVEEYTRILSITADQFEEILGFYQDPNIWNAQFEERLSAEEERRPIRPIKVLEYDLKHLISGKTYTLSISSALSRVSYFSNRMKKTPWVEYMDKQNEGWPKIGYAVLGQVKELSEIPHFFLSLRDNDEVVAMMCGRIVLVCDDPTVPTMTERGFYKGGN